jgi:hypothetical protein
MTTVVIDWQGQQIKVGQRVKVGDERGIVVSISDPDGDVDSYGRTVGINPSIEVRFPGDTERFGTTWTATGPWDEDAPYECEDVEVVG